MAKKTPPTPSLSRRPPAAAWNRVNRSQLAALLGVHPETVTAFLRAGMPVEVQGTRGKESVYDAPLCLGWWRHHHASASAKEVAQTRSYEATAKLNELKLKQQQGELLKRDVVITQGRAYTVGWAGQVRSIARRARQSGIIATPAAEAALADLCRQILTNISSWTTPAAALAAEEAA